MSRFAINPPDEDRYDVNPDHEADEIRRQACACFVASLRDYAHQCGWQGVVFSAAVAHGMGGWSTPCADAMRSFAEGYGWPSTLRAIAQAMEADERLRAECEGRR